MNKVLIIGGGWPFYTRLAKLLVGKGLRGEAALDVEAALRKVEGGPYLLVLLSLEPPKMGLEALERMLKVRPELSVAVVHGPDHHDDACSEAIKRGAYDCLAKPIREEHLDLLIRNALERARLLSENTSLKQEILRDDLTTAYNRRFLEAYLVEELERARRYRRPFAILFLDLDHLKAINDAYGHLYGSLVLREAAALLQGKLRRSDKIFRFGGDEFVVTLPETDFQGAFRVAQRLRRALRGHRFKLKGGVEARITASFGIATFPDNGSSKEELLRSADAAMYQVKETTRDGIGATSLRRGRTRLPKRR